MKRKATSGINEIGFYVFSLAFTTPLPPPSMPPAQTDNKILLIDRLMKVELSVDNVVVSDVSQRVCVCVL